MNKLADWIDPADVVKNGSRSMHGINRGVKYNGNKTKVSKQKKNKTFKNTIFFFFKIGASAKESLWIDSLDASLVNPGALRLWRFTNEIPQMRYGMSFNLFNNVYDT